MFKQFFDIQKVDADQRMVYGYASTESVDAQGETVTKAAMQAAWDDYMKFANLREMHSPSAVGVVKEYNFDENGVFIGAHVVDDNAWKKVTEGVYKGFSIGGKKLKDGFDAVTKTITGLKLTEISLVDRPANPDALITMYKADMLEDETMLKSEQIAEMISKGEITAERLLELISLDKAAKDTTSDVSKVDAPKEPSALRKGFKAIAASPEDIAKGLWTVADLANAVSNLRWLQESCAYEAQNEGDNSPIPAKLAQCIADLAQTLVEMAQEEVSELVAQLQGADGKPAIEVLTSLVQNAAKAADVTKSDNEQTAQENTPAKEEPVKTEVSKSDETAEVKKADDHAHDHTSGDVAKALGLVEKLSGEMGTLRKLCDSLKGENEELKKKFSEAPSVPKGALRVVEKGTDIGTEMQGQEIEPVLKQDGTVDDVATAIKKVHAGGGRRVF